MRRKYPTPVVTWDPIGSFTGHLPTVIKGVSTCLQDTVPYPLFVASAFSINRRLSAVTTTAEHGRTRLDPGGWTYELAGEPCIGEVQEIGSSQFPNLGIWQCSAQGGCAAPVGFNPTALYLTSTSTSTEDSAASQNADSSGTVLESKASLVSQNLDHLEDDTSKSFGSASDATSSAVLSSLTAGSPETAPTEPPTPQATPEAPLASVSSTLIASQSQSSASSDPVPTIANPASDNSDEDAAQPDSSKASVAEPYSDPTGATEENPSQASSQNDDGNVGTPQSSPPKASAAIDGDTSHVEQRPTASAGSESHSNIGDTEQASPHPVGVNQPVDEPPQGPRGSQVWTHHFTDLVTSAASAAFSVLEPTSPPLPDAESSSTMPAQLNTAASETSPENETPSLSNNVAPDSEHDEEASPGNDEASLPASPADLAVTPAATSDIVSTSASPSGDLETSQPTPVHSSLANPLVTSQTSAASELPTEPISDAEGQSPTKGGLPITARPLTGDRPQVDFQSALVSQLSGVLKPSADANQADIVPNRAKPTDGTSNDANAPTYPNSHISSTTGAVSASSLDSPMSPTPKGSSTDSIGGIIFSGIRGRPSNATGTMEIAPATFTGGASGSARLGDLQMTFASVVLVSYLIFS